MTLARPSKGDAKNALALFVEVFDYTFSRFGFHTFRFGSTNWLHKLESSVFFH